MLKSRLTDKVLLLGTGEALLSFPKVPRKGTDLATTRRKFMKYCEQQAMIKELLLQKLRGEDDALSEGFRTIADENYSFDGEVDSDPGAVVSISDEVADNTTGIRGAYVQCWRFVHLSELSVPLRAKHRAIVKCPECQGKFLAKECDVFARGCVAHEGATSIEDLVTCEECNKQFRFADWVDDDDCSECRCHEGAKEVKDGKESGTETEG